MMRLVSAQITFMLIPACVNGFIATPARLAWPLLDVQPHFVKPPSQRWDRLKCPSQPQPVCGALPWALSHRIVSILRPRGCA